VQSYGPEVAVPEPGIEALPSESPLYAMPEVAQPGHSQEPLPEALSSAEHLYEAYLRGVFGSFYAESDPSCPRASSQRGTRFWRLLGRRRVPAPEADLESGLPTDGDVPPQTPAVDGLSTPWMWSPSSTTNTHQLPAYAELGDSANDPFDPFERGVFPPAATVPGRLPFEFLRGFIGAPAILADGVGGDKHPHLLDVILGPQQGDEIRDNGHNYRGIRDMQRSYLRQLDLRVSRRCRPETAREPAWPKPLDYLVGHLQLVSRSFRQSYSITAFLLLHSDQFSARLPRRSGPRKEENEYPNKIEGSHRALPYEFVVFALESWFMLDLSPVVDRHQGDSSDRIEDLLRLLLPAHGGGECLQQRRIAPGELTAAQLRDWKKMKFVWTSDITEHLVADTSARAANPSRYTPTWRSAICTPSRARTRRWTRWDSGRTSRS
jgi:hypothetical protein